MAAAFSTVIFDGHDLASGLAILRDAGATEVEPAFIAGYTAVAEDGFTEREGRILRDRITGAGLAVTALSAHLDLGRPEAAPGLLRRLDFARGLGARTVITNATTADREAAFHTTLDATLPAYAAAGVTLAVENPGHGSGALIPDGATGARIVAAVAHPALRLNYDLCNALTYARGQIDLAADLAAALPHAARLHLKDVAEDGSDWRFCPLGQGLFATRRDILAAALDFGLPCALEHPLRLWRPGRGDPQRLPDPPDATTILTTARSSLAFLAGTP